MIHVRRPFYAALFLAASGLAAFAQQDVTLENIVVGKEAGKGGLSIPRIEVKGSTLDRSELKRLFSSELEEEEARTLLSRFKAQSLSIPLAEAKDDDAAGALKGVVLSGIDAGRIGKFGVASLEMKGKDDDGGAFDFRSGKFEADGIDLSFLLDVAAGRDLSPRIRSMVWENFAGTFTESGAKGGSVNATLAAITAQTDFETYAKPSKGEFKLQNLVLTPEKGSKIGRDLAAFGYDRLDFGMRVVGGHDPAQRKASIEDFTISSEGVGSLQFKAALGNVDKGLWSSDRTVQAAALLLADASRVEMSFNNAGLFEKTIAYVAKMQKRKAEDLRKEWAGLAGQLLPALMGGDPTALKLAGEVQKFILEPKSLKIVVTAKGGSLPLAQLASMQQPMELLQKVTIEAQAN